MGEGSLVTVQPLKRGTGNYTGPTVSSGRDLVAKDNHRNSFT